MSTSIDRTPHRSAANIIGGYVAAACLGAMVATGGSFALAQTKSQPGTPSKQPGTKSEQPRQNPAGSDNNQNDGNNNNNNQGDGRDDGDDSDNRRLTDDDTLLENDNDRDDNRRGNNNRNPDDQNQQQRAQRGYSGPFSLSSPENEARFTESSRRLARLEDRMGQSNERLTHRLGEIRSLPSEQRTDALYDLLQQMLLSNSELQDYLVQSRTAWAGDLPTDSDSASGDTRLDDEGNTPLNRRPSDNPTTSPRPGNNSGSGSMR